MEWISMETGYLWNDMGRARKLVTHNPPQQPGFPTITIKGLSFQETTGKRWAPEYLENERNFEGLSLRGSREKKWKKKPEKMRKRVEDGVIQGLREGVNKQRTLKKKISNLFFCWIWPSSVCNGIPPGDPKRLKKVSFISKFLVWEDFCGNRGKGRVPQV